MKKVLDRIVEQALEQALAGLTARARDMVEQALGQALEAKVRELLGEDSPQAQAPTRAKAKALETLALETQAKAPVKPRKRKAQAQAPQAQDDLETILQGAKVALGKYAGATTPRGKALPEVLYRRIRKVLEHAQSLGRADIPALAKSALAHIASDPMGTAMGSWQYLAGRLGLPVPIQGGEE